MSIYRGYEIIKDKNSFYIYDSFSNDSFKTEEEARSKAEELRLKTPGVQKTNSNRVAGPLIKKMAADGVESERKFKAKLSGYSRKKKKPGYSPKGRSLHYYSF